jgi:hypothetical protein
MALHQQPCNGQKAHDRVVIQEMILREDDLLTMPPERVNAILVTFNEGHTLEEAARLSNEFLGMLGQIRAAFIYSHDGDRRWRFEQQRDADCPERREHPDQIALRGSRSGHWRPLGWRKK